MTALTLAAKLVSRDESQLLLGMVPPSAIQPLARYVFALAEIDTAVDVRDRARMLNALVERAGLLAAASRASNVLHEENGDLDEAAWRSGVQYEGFEQEPQAGPLGVVLRKEQVRHILRAGKVVPAEVPLWSNNRTFSSLLQTVSDGSIAQTPTRSLARLPSSLVAQWASRAACLSGQTRAQTQLCATLRKSGSRRPLGSFPAV